MNRKFSIAIHGGAGTLVKGMMTPEKEKEYKAALELSLNQGYEILRNGGRAVDAVEEAVKQLEDSHLFNAGRGSVFTNAGTHEMDASIMEGKTLQAGAVSLITGIKNPISLARSVMEKANTSFLLVKERCVLPRNLGLRWSLQNTFTTNFAINSGRKLKTASLFN